MFRLAFSGLIRRTVVMLALGAWLLGASWHGAMQVQAAFGDEVCTAEGSKRLPGGAPSQPGPTAKSCSLCAAAGAPSLATADVAGTLSASPDANPPVKGSVGALIPASHLADLASRAPPRA